MSEPTRRHPRYEIETQVIYSVEESSGTNPSQMAKGVCSRNLGEGGLLLDTEEHLPPGTRLSLLLIRGKRGPIEGRGEIVWAEGAPSGPGFRHGVRITHMEPSQQSAWEFFLDDASRQIGRRPIRFEIDLPLTCRPKDSEAAWAGHAVAVNASRGGFLVLLPVRFPVDTVLCLEAQSQAQSLKTEARVVRVDDPREDGLIPHGLAFVDSQDGSRILPALFLLGLI